MKGWKTLLISNNQIQAEVVKSFLESRDIMVFMRGEAAGPLYGLSSGPLAQVELLVPAEQYDLALNILEEYRYDVD